MDKTVTAARLVWLTLMMVFAFGCANAARAAECNALKGLHVEHLTIESVEAVPAGSYQPPKSPQAFADLPAFCRVVARLHPVPESSIGLEVWLPTTGWNHRYQQVGNHGFAGVIQWVEMAPQLKRGFAVAATDDGHEVDPRYISDPRAGAFDLSWADGHPARLEDAAWRAVHVAAKAAKRITAAYYGAPATATYFNGCSDGGREGMMEAQRFPADFDGILAGGAATNTTHGATQQLVAALNMKRAGITGARGVAILTLAEAAEIKQCDGLDGVIDGIISDPTRCHFDPHTLICKPGDTSSNCITPAQADALAANLQPLRDPATGAWIFGGMTPGSEFNQVRFGYPVLGSIFAVANYRYALNDPKWDPVSFELDRDMPKLDAVIGIDNALDPNLSAFKARGGKLIEYHDWADAAFTPAWNTMYYDQVVKTVGHGRLADVQRFYRLFMVPGVGHCGGGPGPNAFGEEGQPSVSDDPDHDAVSALVAWVEHGRAPDQLIAAKFVGDDPKKGVQMQRPLYPYPAEAVWNGTGDTNLVSSFHSSVPLARPRADAETTTH